MPTAGKLAGAVIFAALGYVIAEAYAMNLPPGTAFPAFGAGLALLGLICGWRIVGAQARSGLVGALNGGLQTAVTMVFLGLFFFSTWQMILKSLRKMYDGPFEAVVGIFEMMVEYGSYAMTPRVLGLMIVGGFVCGWLTGMIGRRYP